MFKSNSEIIRIEAQSMNEINTGVVFWSHDRGTAKLIFKLVKNNLPQSLPEGTTVPIRLTFSSSTAEGGIGKHDYLATIDDRINGLVSIVLQDNILGYQGRVNGSIYIDFPNDRSLDTAGRFTFDIKRSPIDDSTPELEDYYFNGFSQTIDKIEKILADGKQEIEQKIAESETQIDAKLKDTNDKITKANQDVATLNTNIDKANDRIDQTNQQIGDLGKLKKMYSNSIDFGDYDYSGNPNLMPYITDPWVGSLLANGDTIKDSVKRVITHTKTRTADAGDILSLGLGIPRTAEANNRYLITALRPSTPYALTVTMSVGSDWTGETNTIGARVRYLNESGGTELPINVFINVLLPANVERDKMITHTFTGTTKANLTGMTNCYVQIFSVNSEDKGTVSVSYDVKLEIGTIATPYQPNLLDHPYWLGKTPLGENIADPTKTFPIKTRAYLVYSGANTEPYIAGQQYTLTMKATKPVTQTFNVFLDAGTIGFGSMTPVEGLTDVWQKTVTVRQDLIDAGVKDRLTIYQVPNSSVGDVQIDWLKIEKGNTRTPNISQFKYFGEGLKDSNNPNDYRWDITPEYTEKGLNNTVSLTDPQSVEGLKNFEDGLQLKGISVVQDNFTSKAVTTKNITDFTEDSIVRFERWGRLVIANIEITNKSANFAGWKNLMAFPSGYTPISLVGWGGTLSNKTNRNPALSVYANSSGISVMISSADLPANQRCSGTVAYFTNDEWPQG